MLRLSTEAVRRLRFCVLGMAAAATVLAVSVDQAEARRYRRHHAHRSSYNPPYSSIVVDANSGKVLQSNNADSQRHPASLTKIMTLYLLFERLETGKLKLDSEMNVSEHASEQAPTKLGLRPGQTLAVEDAIKGLVTKSANDAAVVIAETIGGDEDSFAKLMTRKARALGMSKTVYRNASGLPDMEQVTTARDQATLGRAIQERFPRYYRYFSTAAFQYRGRVIRNHNKLLGRVEGVDGIKTGYTRASGFNLVTSVRRGNRHLVSVVLGGRSGGARDAAMRSLIAEYIGDAATKRTAPMIAENSTAESKVAQAEPATSAAPAQAPMRLAASEIEAGPNTQPAPAPVIAAKPVVMAENAPKTAPVQAVPANAQLSSGVIEGEPLSIIPGSSEPMVPHRVKTVQVRSGKAKPAAAAPAPVQPVVTASVAQPVLAAKNEPASSRAPSRLPPVQADHGIGTGILGVLPARHGDTMASAEPWPRPASAKTTAFPAPVPATAVQPAPAVAAPAAVAAAAPVPTRAAAPAPSKPVLRSGWIIQVGAFDDEKEARERLDDARGRAKAMLGKADPFTEAVAKGDKTLYRARFAGLGKDEAEAVCRTLKRNEISCITIKN